MVACTSRHVVSTRSVYHRTSDDSLPAAIRGCRCIVYSLVLSQGLSHVLAEPRDPTQGCAISRRSGCHKTASSYTSSYEPSLVSRQAPRTMLTLLHSALKNPRFMFVLRPQLAAFPSMGNCKLGAVRPEYLGEIDWRSRNVNNPVVPSAGGQKSEVPVCETEGRGLPQHALAKTMSVRRLYWESVQYMVRIRVDWGMICAWKTCWIRKNCVTVLGWDLVKYLCPAAFEECGSWLVLKLGGYPGTGSESRLRVLGAATKERAPAAIHHVAAPSQRYIRPVDTPAFFPLNLRSRNSTAPCHPLPCVHKATSSPAVTHCSAPRTAAPLPVIVFVLVAVIVHCAPCALAPRPCPPPSS